MKDIYVLGIETSCDETSAAIVKNGRCVISNVISSQIDIHKKFGGVVPEIAARKHLEIISQVIDQAIFDANMKLNDIDVICVTCGPGLVGALLVGVSYAKTLAFCLNKPLVGVNHIAGHICANYLENNFEPPFICSVISGGHTNLIYVSDYDSFEVLSRTRDDAAGEAFDKVARVLDLGYPGGPAIDNLARFGDPMAIKFPKALENDLDFSFSGLKSHVINFVNKNEITDELKADIAASFEHCVAEVIVKKTFVACEKKHCKKIALAGGVSSNSYLRHMFEQECKTKNYTLNIPKSIFCTDNAAMIASSAYFKYILGYTSNLYLNAYPNLKLCEEKNEIIN